MGLTRALCMKGAPGASRTGGNGKVKKKSKKTRTRATRSIKTRVG